MPSPLDSPNASHLPSGTSVGDFELLGAIETTDVGTLHVAVRARDDLSAAVRVVPPVLAADDVAWGRFIEVQSEAWDHDRRHVAPVVGSGRLPDGSGWVAWGLAEGRTLAQQLAEQPLEPGEVAAMLRGVCRALESAHRHGLAHGHLEPSSICISSDADGRMRARLYEFGAAALLRVAPSVDGDIDSIGRLCFRALTGEPCPVDPTDEVRVSDVRAELGPHFDEPVHSLLDARTRPASAGEAFVRILEAARSAGYEVGTTIPTAPRRAQETPAPVEPPGSLPPDSSTAETIAPPRPHARPTRRVPVAAVGAALVLAVLAIAYALWF